MAKTSERSKLKPRRRWSNLSGDKPMTGVDRALFFTVIGLVILLFMVIYASRPPFQIS